MLSARDTRTGSILALPEHEGRDALENVRGDATGEFLRCPACRAALWLRAGDKVCPHFAHRVLAECALSSVSLPILISRRLLYQYFQGLMKSAALAGTVELEPIWPTPSGNLQVDLMLNFGDAPPVAVILVGKGVKSERRSAFRTAAEEKGAILRPVFLSSTMKREDDESLEFSLSTTQRNFRHQSAFGQVEGSRLAGRSLHFIDPETAMFTSLRHLFCVHAPQGFAAEYARTSPMGGLLWSKEEGEWWHQGEIRNPHEPERLSDGFSSSRLGKREGQSVGCRTSEAASTGVPAWMIAGLRCVGCGEITTQWTSGVPTEGRCVCKACFDRGTRL